MPTLTKCKALAFVFLTLLGLFLLFGGLACLLTGSLTLWGFLPCLVGGGNCLYGAGNLLDLGSDEAE